MNKNKTGKDDLLSLKFIIFSILFVIGTISFRADSLYIFEDMQNYCYYCYDRTKYELTNGDNNYVYVQYGQNIDIAELQKNL